MKCDICSDVVEDGSGKRISSNDFKIAVRAGFTPYKGDFRMAVPLTVSMAMTGMNEQQVIAGWKNKALNDDTDWILCDRCYPLYQTAGKVLIETHLAEAALQKKAEIRRLVYAIGGTVILVLVVGIRVGLIYRERHQDIKAPETASYTSDPDDLVFLKKLRPDSMKDVKELTGKTLWVSAGGQMDYYPYTAHKVEYAKSQGVLLGVEPLVVKDAVEQVAPKSATFRIPGGDRQVLLVFTLPKSKDPAAQFAVPVGDREGATYTFQTDEIFFYEDPHVLYKHWTPEQWAAIDEHRVIPGMNERQVQLSLGQVSSSQSLDYGNRTVIFDHQGHPVDVTFEKNKATVIRGK